MADTAAPAFRDGAEASHREWRAEIELHLEEQIKEWRAETEASPPLRLGSASIDLGRDAAYEDRVSATLWGTICSYLQAETENFAVILLYRGIRGHDAVQALRSWLTAFVNPVRKYKCDPPLSSVDIDNPPDWWP